MSVLKILFSIVIFLFVVCIGVFGNDHGPKNVSFGPRYEKLSIDDTPLMLITDKQTRCQYVYDTVKKTLDTDIGFEDCIFHK